MRILSYYNNYVIMYLIQCFIALLFIADEILTCEWYYDFMWSEIEPCNSLIAEVFVELFQELE